jgi:uncharacterized membrane-anchored protein YhcB (DUF1043 family)
LIEYIFTFIVGVVLGYIIKSEKHPVIAEATDNQIKRLQEDVEYYKKLTKQLADENMEFRRKK